MLGSDKTSEKVYRDIFLAAVKNILDDDSFKLNSPIAGTARKVAEDLLNWSSTESGCQKMEEFSKNLHKELEKPFVMFHKAFNREKLWRSYFLLRSSEEFIKLWTVFLNSANLTPTPSFYQHLTDIVFRKMIQDHLLFSSPTNSDTVTPISHQEGSALRYAAGYVCRHLRKKIKRESHELKEELLLCLMALVKDKSSEECGNDEQWTMMMDRGGLWHVKETTYSLLLSIEEEIQCCLRTLTTATPKSKCEIIKQVTSSEDVQFYWLITTADFEFDDRETHETLLYMIVELYLTIRGYSYASAWMEKFKQFTKTATQRSKSLRRDLYESLS